MKKKDFFVKFSGYISVMFVAGAFVLVGLLTISKTGRTVREIIIESALGFIVGILIDSILGMQGINNGKRNELFLNTKSVHGEAVEAISPHIHLLDGWCRSKNEEALKLQRTKILAAMEMKYDDYFDSEGQGKGYTLPDTQSKQELKKARRKARAYKKALMLRLTPLSASTLTSDSVHPDDPFYFGDSEAGYERKALASDVFKKLLTALIFGYYTVDQLVNFSPAALLWRLLQVTIYIVTGVMKMLSAQGFIIGDYRGQIIQKVNYLQMFKNHVERGEKNG